MDHSPSVIEHEFVRLHMFNAVAGAGKFSNLWTAPQLCAPRQAQEIALYIDLARKICDSKTEGNGRWFNLGRNVMPGDSEEEELTL